MTTTVGKLLLKHNVPDNLKKFVEDNVMDKKGIAELFRRLSEGSPEQYKRTVNALARLGFEVSTRQGSSVPMSDLSPLDDKDAKFDALAKDITEIKAGLGTKQEKTTKIHGAYDKFTKDFEKSLTAAGEAKNHTLTKVLKAGARGTMQQYRQTVGAVILVNDDKGRPIYDYPIRHSFAEGLSVPEYLLHGYGTRAGALGTKLSIADAGYFSKQLSRAAMPVKIEEHDCGTENGIEVSVKSKDYIGTFLAKPVKEFKRNNEVTAQMLLKLDAKGVDHIMVRSPTTCASSKKHHDWAVCQLCAGRREKGVLAPMDSYLGLSAAGALAEPLAQGQLNTKHSAAGAVTGKTVATGFKLIQQLANVPHTFQNKAAVSESDGIVSVVRKLPQGGSEVVVNNQGKKFTHYVPAGFATKVTVGSHVEQGDVLSEGIVNPADIVRHRGIGEGRKHYSDVMSETFQDAGMGGNRRNFEVIARAAIDHVRVTHPEGYNGHLPDALISYQGAERNYQARDNSKQVRLDAALGKYLEAPALHLTIGTRITKADVAYLKKHKIESLLVNDEPPPFVPEMTRLLDVPGHVDDWAHQLYSSYLEKRLINSVNRGLSSSLAGPSPILGLSYGVNFSNKKAEDESADEPEDIEPEDDDDNSLQYSESDLE